MNTEKSKTIKNYKNSYTEIKINQKIILLYNGLTGVPKRLHCEETIEKGFTKKRIRSYVLSTGKNINIRHNQFKFNSEK
jgi:hypothetical protein